MVRGVNALRLCGRLIVIYTCLCERERETRKHEGEETKHTLAMPSPIDFSYLTSCNTSLLTEGICFHCTGAFDTSPCTRA